MRLDDLPRLTDEERAALDDCAVIEGTPSFACGACNGSGLDPVEGSLCEVCEGSGNAPDALSAEVLKVAGQPACLSDKAARLQRWLECYGGDPVHAAHAHAVRAWLSRN